MVAGLILCTLFLVLPAVAGVFVFRRAAPGAVSPAGSEDSANPDVVERALYGLATFGGGVLLWTLLYTPFAGPTFDTNGRRLAPALAMVKGVPQGYSLYQHPTEGVMTGWLVGPVSALLYLPAAVWSGPSNAIFTAILINLIVSIGPAALAIALSARSTRGRRFVPVAILVFAWLLPGHEGLRDACLMVSPDGPALGLACASIALMIRPLWRQRWGMRIGSAVLVVLACWTKQSMLPILVVVPVYLWLVEGRRAAMMYLAALLLCGLAISAMLIGMFGASRMWFHMVSLPWSHGWRGQGEVGRLNSLWRAFGSLLIDSAEQLVSIVFTGCLYPWSRPPGPDSGDVHSAPPRGTLRRWVQCARDFASDSTWTMFAAAAVTTVPASILGYARENAAANNLGLTGYFLGLTFALMLLATVERIERPMRMLALVRSLACLAVAVKAAQMLVIQGNFAEMTRRMADFYDNPEERALAFVQKAPDSTYLPMNPLVTLCATGKLHHIEDGLANRMTGPPGQRRLDSTPQRILAHLPADLLRVALPAKGSPSLALSLFPNARLVDSASLNGFILLSQPAGSAPSPQAPAGVSPGTEGGSR